MNYEIASVALNIIVATLVVTVFVVVIGYAFFLFMGPMNDGVSDGELGRWDGDKYTGLNNAVYLAGRRHGTTVRDRAAMRRSLRRSVKIR